MHQDDDHDRECTRHNHSPNPYVTDPTDEGMFRNFLTDLLQMSALTVDFDVETVYKFDVVAIHAMALDDATGNPDVTRANLNAIMFEMGRILNVLADGRDSPQFRRAKPGPAPEPGRDENGVDAFMVEMALQTFLAASSDGDLDRAMRVVESVHREAEATQHEPDRFVLAFAVSIMVSLALTVAHNAGRHDD